MKADDAAKAELVTPKKGAYPTPKEELEKAPKYKPPSGQKDSGRDGENDPPERSHVDKK